MGRLIDIRRLALVVLTFAAAFACYIDRVGFPIVYTAIAALLSNRDDRDRDRRGGGGMGGGMFFGPRMYFSPFDFLWYFDPYYYERRAYRAQLEGARDMKLTLRQTAAEDALVS